MQTVILSVMPKGIVFLQKEHNSEFSCDFVKRNLTGGRHNANRTYGWYVTFLHPVSSKGLDRMQLPIVICTGNYDGEPRVSVGICSIQIKCVTHAFEVPM